MDQLVANRKRERRLTILIALAVVAATISFGLAACSSLDQTTSSTSANSSEPDDTPSARHRSGGGIPGAADGVLPDNASPFDTDLPGIAKLNPKLLEAVQAAAKAAEEDGIELHLATGWRSKKYQEELMEKAIQRYGSRKKASQYVASPETSHHVTGNAVDIGPTDADDWVNRHGNKFGLCQTLANEIWHFELATTPGGTCPPPQASSDG